MSFYEAFGAICIGMITFLFIRRAQTLESSQKSATWLAAAGTLSVLAAWGVARYFHTLSLTRMSIEQEQTARAEVNRPEVHEQTKLRSLKTEIDFVDSDVSMAGELVSVETERISATFTTMGGCLTRYACKRMVDGMPGDLSVFDVDPATEREALSGLVAFDQKTPLAFSFLGQEATEAGHVVRFRSENELGIIEKTYLFSNTQFVVDVTVRIVPRAGVALQPRIFWTAPYNTHDVQAASCDGLVLQLNRNDVETQPIAQLEGRTWVTPQMVGAMDRYFVSALIQDPNHGALRAYYRVHAMNRVSTVIEGPEVSTDTTWKLSFYVGPKVLRELQNADARLVSVLNYSWFNTIAVVLKTALDFVHQYIPNYGFAIILLILLLKFLMLPLAISAESGRKRMAEMRRKMQYLERRYKDHPETLEREKLELVKKYGVGDMFSSLLIAVMQACMFIGMQRILAVSYELYRTPFFGWIKDLSVADPYYVLPFLCAFALFYRMYHDSKDEGAARRIQSVLLACVMFGVFSYFSAGLLLACVTMGWFDVLIQYGRFA